MREPQLLPEVWGLAPYYSNGFYFVIPNISPVNVPPPKAR